MSNRWLNDWLAAACWLRALSFTGSGLLLFLLLWQGWLRPAQQQAQRLERQAEEQRGHYRQQLRALRILPPLALLERQLAELDAQAAEEKGQPFSLPALLAASGGKLERWQPLEHGGELLLSLRWQQFAALDSYLLASGSAVAIPSLMLQGEAPQLQLLMELQVEK